MIRYRLLLVFSIIFFCDNLFAQDARTILREVNTKFARVRDYSASVQIRADIPFVRMMPVKAKVWFKQPDRFYMQSSGIALLPRQGFDQLFKDLRDTNGYMPVLQGTESLRGHQVTVINVLPVSDTADLLLGKLWVDASQDLILKDRKSTRLNSSHT